MKPLLNDVARCHGVRWGNEKDGRLIDACKTCKRRLQIALDPPTARVSYFYPPLFDNGVCPSKIGEDR